MKLSGGYRLAIGLLAAATLLMGGCSFTTATKEYAKPKEGPPVSTGISVVLPEIKDARSWIQATTTQTQSNVRYFAPQITKKLRTGLTDAGFFLSMPDPDDPAAAGISNRLDVMVTNFGLQKTQYNALAMLHLLADGLLLPAFAVTNIVTAGRVDMGAYLIPSSTAATVANVNLNFMEELENRDRLILTRAYSLRLSLGAVSERQLDQGVSEDGEFGVKVGAEEADKMMDELVLKISRDPYWAYLGDYRKIVLAEEKATVGAMLEDKIEAANSVLDLLRPMPFTPTEASVVLNSKLTLSSRADIINDLRGQRLGKEAVEAAPYTEERIGELFDDIRVSQCVVEAGLAKRALKVAMSALRPAPVPEAAESGAASQTESKPEAAAQADAADKETKQASQPKAKPAGVTINAAGQDSDTQTKTQKAEDGNSQKGDGPPLMGAKPVSMPMDPENADALRKKLIQDMAARFKGNPQLQSLLLGVADFAVGEMWKPMFELLKEVDSPITRAYLENRTS